MLESLAMDSDTLAQAILRPDFWRKHFPGLTLPDANIPSRAKSIANTAGDADESIVDERLHEEGYFQDHNATCERLSPPLAEAVKTCVKLNIPPVFIFMFDEAWECFQSMHPMLSRILGADYKVLPDFWVWHVDPKAGEAGWKPHRDKGRHALAPDGSPLSLSIWVPMLDATPLTSCMYILPANRDPVYGTENEGKWEIRPRSVRALPGRQGDYFCWNQAVLHWGSESSRFAPHPRISMSVEFQRGDMEPFNEPQMNLLELPAFPGRLSVIGRQLLQYRHMYPESAHFENLAGKLGWVATPAAG